MAVSKRLRHEVLKRDNFTCRDCGRTSSTVELQIDHVVPVSLGGGDEPANLATRCADCNAGKSSSAPGAPLVADVAEDAVRWSAAIQASANAMLADRAARAADHERFSEHWGSWTYAYGARRYEVPKDDNWRQSVDNLLAVGLPMVVLLDCADLALGKTNLKKENVFRYMCGIAWNKVTQLQEQATRITNGEPLEASGNGGARSAFDAGRRAVATAVLGELADEERDRYVEWADDGGWGDAHGEPQTEAEQLADAAVSAMNDVRCDLASVEQKIIDVFSGLPDDVGQTAMRDARNFLYRTRGADFSRTRFLLEALSQLTFSIRAGEANEILSVKPEEQQDEWLRLSAAAHPVDRGPTALLVWAGMAAKANEENLWHRDMCRAPGTHIPACPERGTYRAWIAELACCAEHGNDGEHEGHLMCERHMEQLVNGTFAGPEGERTLIDYRAISEPEEVEAPF